ncbi:MAG: EF-P lysine aminoacylase EpmA [Gammaproteobacteria bacterium]
MAPHDPTQDDTWRPSASIATLQRRAELIQDIRRFFAGRRVLEVETPALSHAASSEPHLQSMQVSGPGMATAYLHTSPELAMKRLLAAGSGDIFQLCKVFRAGEQGSRHNPEFTLLEWYRLGLDMQALMQEVGELLTELLAARLAAPPRVITYQQAFQDYAGIDPFAASPAQMEAAFRAHVNEDVVGVGEADWPDLLLSRVVQPRLPADRLVFITHFPAAQASLARLDAHNPQLACRFEAFFGGLELANGFEELTDRAEQQRRIEAEQAARQASGLPCLPSDVRFLAALQAGLPPCSGVAVGVDRVVMLACGQDEIARVLSFDFARA